ncbi:MAG: homoserine O-acetyltransferase [Haemophilus parainfluenzae]|nr:homoserine O-acetyltransferase [Haemophilus parainfluenzae]
MSSVIWLLFQDNPLQLTLGGQLSPINVAYQTYGTLNADKSNVVLICHALTGDAEPYFDEPNKNGWWQNFMGDGLAFDTSKYFFICSNVLGGCKGTTGPSSINPTTGKPYGSQFPNIIVQDIIKVQKALLDYLGIRHLKAIVGGSFGGMQATQWAIDYPDFMDNIVNLCSSIFFSAEAIGFNHVMRQAVINDPNFNNGDYYEGAPPNQGLSIARESYLSYQGKKFLERFDANTYLHLLRALDLYDPSVGYTDVKEALSRIKACYTLVSVTTDQLFKSIDLHKSKQLLEQAGVDLRFYEFPSDYGHDAFLVDYTAFENKIRSGLEGESE